MHAPSESLGFPVDGVPQINNLFDDPVSRPAYGNAGGHSGIDFGTTNDKTPVLAMAGGTVTKVVTDQVGGGVEDNYDRTVPNTYHPDHPLGNQVQITTSDGNVHVYGHLAHGTITLNRGDTVEKDGQLGIAGATGYTRGGHVHVEVRPGGSDVSALHACPVRIRGGDDFLADLPTEGAAAPSTIPTTSTSLIITSGTVAPVYRDANPESPVLSRLQKGATTYTITAAAGCWFRIQYDTATLGNQGWVHERYVQTLPYVTLNAVEYPYLEVRERPNATAPTVIKYWTQYWFSVVGKNAANNPDWWLIRFSEHGYGWIKHPAPTDPQFEQQLIGTENVPVVSASPPRPIVLPAVTGAGR